jgi:hypothetical protein
MHALKTVTAVLLALEHPSVPTVVVLRYVMPAEPSHAVGKDERAGPEGDEETDEEGVH